MLADNQSEANPVPESGSVELDSDQFGVEEGRFVVPDLIGGDTECWHAFSAVDPHTNEPCAPTLEDANPRKKPCTIDSIYPIPINSHDPPEDALGTFEEAISAVHRSRQKHGDEGLDGVMLSISQIDDLYCVDLDDVVDTETGVVDAEALAILEEGHYSELSPSGSGTHTLVLDSEGLDDEYKKSGEIEIYTDLAVTYTGRWIRGTSQSIERQDGLVQALQHAHNSKLSSTSSSSSGSTSASSGSSGIIRLKNCRSPITDRDVELTDLSLELQELAEYGCKFDDVFATLFEDGRERWHEVETDSGGFESASEAEMSLCRRICWWAEESDAFADESFDDVELERLFLASDLGKRAKNRERDAYTLYNIRKARKTEIGSE